MKDSHIKIVSYSESSITLSNQDKIVGSCILTDSGDYSSIDLPESEENFLSNKDSYKFLTKYKEKEIFLVGCGKNFIIPSINIKKTINHYGLKLEWSITTSSMQIFNMLIEDSRSCVALLIN